MSAPITVMIVDDSPSTREMLREALGIEAGVDVVGEAGSAAEAIVRAAELAPDVVLMDVRMPDGNGVDAARTILARHPATRIVALTWSDDPATVRDMLSAGAIGFVVKGCSVEELVEAIHRAAAGAAGLDKKVLPGAIEDLRRLLEEERERRDQIERLARAREEFVQVLSHELRTPLTVISAALRLPQRPDVRPEEAELLQSAFRRLDQLEFLAEGLELIVTDPSAEGAADARLAVAAAARRLDEPPDRASIDPEPWPGVPNRLLERVAFELLSNAVRHGARPIEVAGSRQGEEAVLTVSDAGGWSPARQDFAAFFQEDMSSTRSRSGFGLGLFVASRLCRACHGELAIASEGGRTVATARFRSR